MGDRVSTDITIGGKLKRADVPTLMNAFMAEGAMGRNNNQDSIELTEKTDPSTIDWFAIDECNYSNIDDLKDVFNELGLAYSQTWGAGNEFPAGQCFNLQDNNNEREAVGEEEATFTATQILEASVDPGKLLKLFEDAEWWKKPMPKLEIID